MKGYTEIERQEHIENWKNGNLTKTGYAKQAGIHPTTFCTWLRGARSRKQGFVEIKSRKAADSFPAVVIEKGDLKIHFPLALGTKELQNVISALGSEQ